MSGSAFRPLDLSNHPCGWPHRTAGRARPTQYENEFAAIDRELPLAECKVVWDVLDMFRVLRSSIEAVGVDAVRRIDEHAESFLAFGGFDLNDTIEGRMLGYVRHLFASDRWSELEADMLARSDGGNSHSPRLAVYTRMLTAFTPIWNDKVRNFLSGHGRQATASGPERVGRRRRSRLPPE